MLRGLYQRMTRPALSSAELKAIADAATLARMVETLPYDALMRLDVAPDSDTLRTLGDVSRPLKWVFPEARSANSVAGGTMEWRICVAENAYVEHAWTHAEFYGPIFACACAGFAVAARHRISADEYALLSAPWREVFGSLPGEEADLAGHDREPS